mmetsp:Transcript_54145/g.115049  ORF Transcript_54145/g.115049 Transcript_54145/m.115049 type:complete len:363 (+) Transcript_54145:80-1168(+)|eukprot:CAMPEP_0172563268 /NCGR_PEP_ID=MMETSP1067-20121228/100146_1 /TAXON_ID=265564 ORGANISM="Thalassiosira punctigera, Strain Tpunct2005C2" /NCGR_SAMPLE_ID=MMETSP1067 /ASSEMBLY_ACC=CAM_ASM_000444 /LENGTH=362 /DNA_ID=CAMNT_0013353681 /DNA_START=74 /DNA_END=1162 /DNA_ORIENTATION=+
MIPPSESQSKTENASASFGECRGSIGSGELSMSSGPRLSMDLFPRFDDVDLDESLLALSSAEILVRLQSAEIFEDTPLPDTAATATATAIISLNAGQPAAASTGHGKPQSQPQRREKIVALSSRMGRMSTGDEIVPLKEDMRVSSADWPIRDDFGSQSVNLAAVNPSLFLNNHPPFASSAAVATQPPTSPHHMLPASGAPASASLSPSLSHPKSTAPTGAYEEYQVPIKPSSNKGKAPASKPKKKTKPRKPRLLDPRPVEKMDDDVLFGRGGGTNPHPGNMKFRKKALELLSWYAQSSKEEKERIANLLVESVENEGNRFLERGKDGMWHQVLRGQHTKACATFRDLKEGMKKKKNVPPPGT